MKKTTILSVLLGASLSVCAQDFIKPLGGTGLYGHVTQVNDSAVIFVNEQKEGKYLLRRNLEFIEYRNQGILYFHAQKQKWLTAAQLEGNPIEQGQNIYIPIHHTDIEEYYMARRLRELVQEDGYWNLVDSPAEAHFNLRVRFCYDKQPQAWFIITTHSGDVFYKSEIVNSGGLNPEQAGVVGAYNLYSKALSYLKKKPYTVFYNYLKKLP